MYLFIIIIIGNISKHMSQNQLCIQINSEQLVSCDCNENIWTRYYIFVSTGRPQIFVLVFLDRLC